MKFLPLTIALLEPVVLSTPLGKRGSAAALNHIPGNVLRGLASSLLASNEEALRTVLSGKLHFLNGLPAGEYDERTLPTPAHWSSEKKDLIPKFIDIDEENSASPSSLGIIDSTKNTEKNLTQKMTRQMFPFCRLGGSLYKNPTTLQKLHIDKSKVNDANASGGMFSYQSLAAGLSFVAMLAVESEDDVQPFLKALAKTEGKVRIGRSRKAGYGLVCITHKGDWLDGECDISQDATGEGKEVRLLCTSDLILSPSTSCWGKAIAEETGLELVCITNAPAGVTGGFNRYWGMHLPQATTVGAGSTALFRRGDCDKKKLEERLSTGLGSRRTEGFGRLVQIPINDPKSGEPTNTIDPIEKPSESDAEDICNLEVKLLDLLVRESIDLWAWGEKFGKIASKALIGRLRQPLRLPTKDALACWRGWLGRPGNSTGKSLAPKARNEVDKIDALRDICEKGKENPSWDTHPVASMVMIKLRGNNQDWASLGNGISRIQKSAVMKHGDAWRVAMLDALLARLQKEAKN